MSDYESGHETTREAREKSDERRWSRGRIGAAMAAAGLVGVLAEVLKEGLGLLGIEALDQM